MASADVWAFAARQLEAGEPCTLILVGAHQGSSPGRRGFKMAVTAQDMLGSIGGGIMEHKFVELVRTRMAAGEAVTELRRQVHSKAAPQDQSGMICSGEQTLLLHSLPLTALPVVQRLLQADAQPCVLRLDPQGLTVLEGEGSGQGLVESGPGTWHYTERVGGQSTAYVVGGGHVGLAMCKLLADLDFRVVNLDDRADLHTMQQNAWADELVVAPYADIAARIPEGSDTYIIVMSFGYRTDAIVMRQLLGRRYAYLGMMGSRAKVAQLWAELRAEGYAEADIVQVSAPAGIAIGSQTPAEIAVSIAAELIQRRQSPTF